MSINTKCQVFTPKEHVQKMLDFVGYTNNIFGKKVAENSCGDGNILCEIVSRYIIDGINQNYSLKKIKKSLEANVWAAEIDKVHIKNCVHRLNEIAAKYGISNVKWNIIQGDFLKQNIKNEFDFVIGNPPYISYQELDEKTRKFVKENFKTCIEGKFDYCYAFIEASLKSLKCTGKLAYLIPINIFKTRFASKLREYIIRYLECIYDYTNKKIFEGKLTASAIIVCNKANSTAQIKYHDLNNNINYFINKNDLTGKWIFKNRDNVSCETENAATFGDYFHTATCIATQCNPAYILSDYKEQGEYVHVDEYKIEKNLVRKAISPRSINYKKDELVIFPYYYKNGDLCRYTEKEFKEKYPFGYRYLLRFKDKLNKRDSDKGICWFEYGRSQALAHLNQSKLMISTLITKSVNTIILDKEMIPTSGLYIISLDEAKYSLAKAEEILKSALFLEYVREVGIISNGNSFRISCTDINNFRFPKDMLG